MEMEAAEKRAEDNPVRAVEHILDPCAPAPSCVGQLFFNSFLILFKNYFAPLRLFLSCCALPLLFVNSGSTLLRSLALFLASSLVLRSLTRLPEHILDPCAPAPSHNTASCLSCRMSRFWTLVRSLPLFQLPLLLSSASSALVPSCFCLLPSHRDQHLSLGVLRTQAARLSCPDLRLERRSIEPHRAYLFCPCPAPGTPSSSQARVCSHRSIVADPVPQACCCAVLCCELLWHAVCAHLL